MFIVIKTFLAGLKFPRMGKHGITWLSVIFTVFAAIMNSDPDNICICQEETFKSHYKFNCEYLNVSVIVQENKFEIESRYENASSYCTRHSNKTFCSGNAIYDDSTGTVHLDVTFNYTEHTWKRLLHLDTICNNGTGETYEEFQMNTCRKCSNVYHKEIVDLYA